MADKMQTSPGCSPRWDKTSFTRSSLRTFLLRINSISMPASPASAPRSRVTDRGTVRQIADSRRSGPCARTDPRSSPRQSRSSAGYRKPALCPSNSDSRNLGCIPLGQKFNVHPKIITNALFGSGYAGLGTILASNCNRIIETWEIHVSLHTGSPIGISIAPKRFSVIEI